MAYQSPWQLAQQSPYPNRRTPPPDEATRARMRANLERNIAESRSKGYGKADFSDLLKPLKQKAKETLADKIAENMRQSEGKKKKPTKGEIKKAAKAGKVLVASLPSTCFSELTWQATSDDGMDGIATGTFINKTQGTWDWDCDLETFLEWTQSGSLGEFFNAEIR